MSTQVMGTVLRSGSAARSGARRVRLEHVVMAGAILSLVILVVLPLLWLFYGSLRGEQGLSLDHFAEVSDAQHDLRYPFALQQPKLVGHKWLAADLNKRLGNPRRNRA